MLIDRLRYLLFCMPFVALITWRLTIDFTQEDGPFALYRMIRKAMLAAEDIPGTGWIARGAECVFCVSFWIGLLVALLFVQPFIQPLEIDYQAFREWIVLALAGSGLTTAYAKYLGF